MNMYVILRRSGWKSAQELKAAAERSARVAQDEFSGRLAWIRSYVVNEEAGRLGTVCIYEATDPQTIREHARRAALPADEIIPVTQTVVMRADQPEPVH